MVANSSALDILTVVFILYFTPGRYRERLASLGVMVKNFTRNVFYGIVGYLAVVPVLAIILAVTALLISLFKYVPEKQPVVELFMKEKNTMFLFYTSLFTAIVGPFIEELFFRGFMYNALKKFTGIFWATMLTAAVFAALHTNVIGFFPILALGIVLAYLYEKTGSLVSSITVHMIHNLSMVMFIFLVKQLGV
jgi:membrane protease YdiL (CAAX protease family)